jgi:hypothetical protein
MKKILFSIAFLGIIAVNMTAQNQEDLNGINPENEDSYEIEDSEGGILLTDFFSYMIRRQHSESRGRYQFEIGLGFFAQSGLTVGGIRNSAATRNGLSESTQFGFVSRFQWRRHALIATYGWSICNFRISDGLKNNILGDYSQFPLEIMPDLLISSASSEIFNRMSIDTMIGYRFVFHRSSSSFAELGVYNTSRVRNRYSARFVGTDYIDIDLSYTRPDIFNRSDTGIQAAVGAKNFSFYTRYRLTDPFRNFDASLPRLIFGLRVAI